ncbi:glycosyltransferase family 2 protein [Terrimonas sp. NA20]|uniref:Glycosyltransferase family 2 protein n=1 Tax=Terrimonas ginsenosidimutans TaxID=2908004 RepID=A0ABS9L0K7_9BACT|nr:glycosyltransferase family 2 protein [Terrimonas ginsenosidimutans]MCG2618002.1 glycosyltransferase family 2 protein [Terrimonas ginsenosidimutans]
MGTPSSSIIISTYNWPEALELCLNSILLQTELPGEIVIADDGSGSPTRQVVDAFKNRSPVPVKHIWHEDQGFRLAAIRNKAIAAASGNYIIQIDGDILLHKYFIADHLRFAKKKSFVRASRIYLDDSLTKKLLHLKQSKISIRNKGVTNKTSGIRVPILWPLFETNYKNKGLERYEIHGCNMAFWKDDAISVNGYNEDFTGWGSEDKEFVARLLNAGYEKRFLKLGGIAFHLYHPINPKPRLAHNEHLLEETIRLQHSFCINGINKYLTPA